VAARLLAPGSTALGLAVAACPALAQTGTLVGRVTDALTGGAIATARVTVTGTRLGTFVDAAGQFRLRDVPSGAREVRARAVGYGPATAVTSVTPDATTTVELRMTAVGHELDAVVVTGSVGDTRRRAVGHAVAVVSAREIVGRSAVANLTEVLQAKVPGLALLPTSGTVGTAASYRLRGTGSLGAGNSPTVYVDGVRVSARDQGGYDVFGQTTTALDAITPADIESIEVIRGPSASTLYGAEAATGVIQIFTRRGRPGRVRWESRLETGRSDWDESLRPVNFAIATPARLADTTLWPGFRGKAIGDVVSFRPMDDGRALRTAALSRLVLSAAGGAERSTFFASVGRSGEEGVYHNNFSRLTSLRGNVTLAPTGAVSVTTSVALSRNHVRLPLNDNAGPVGLIASSFLAIPGRSYGYPGSRNYATMTPELANRYDNQVRADRYTFGATAEHAPVRWLRNTLRVGLDANVGQAELYFAPDSATPYPSRASLGFDNARGLIAQAGPLNQDVTVHYDGTVTGRMSSRLRSTTSLGMQYLANRFRRTSAIGVGFGSGALRSVASAAVRSSADSSSEQKSVGVYVQQQLSRDDRLFLTVAARIDNNSAFGRRLKAVLYPKASVSYVISEEPYFRVPGIGALRLRAAWGQAGNSPGPFDAARSYTASVVTSGDVTESALRYGSAGNPNLRPERGSESEAGFEVTLLEGRVELDASYYSKTTHDALIPVAVPPSSGFTGEQLTNLGTISNRGVEAVVRSTFVRRRALTADATLSFSTNRNRLVSFGDTRSPIVIGFNAPSQRHQEGFPLGGMWGQRLRYNPDGTLLKVDGRPVPDTTDVYLGPSVPTREVALAGGLLLLGRLRLHGLADYKGGHHQFNVTDRRRDRAGVSWETVNPAADPDEVLLRQSAFHTMLHIQPADFVKLRDLSIGYDVPPRFLRGVARGAVVTAAGHNLKIWTRYGGADPEVNQSGPLRFNRDDLWTVPQTRRYSASVALTF
jgi:TonB-dependent SusC/RagA subfamily outer membrane receptor